MSYKSPIELVMGQFRMEQEKRIEGEVFKAIQDYGINIDKNELIRALKYDRDQYNKGYKDGIVEAKADIVRKMQERLKEKAYTNNYWHEVVLVSDVDQIAKEMLEETNGNV